MTEWYVNGPLGLQQGFTVTNDPATEGSGPLKLRLGLVGGVVAEISEDGGSAEIRQANGGPSFTYSGLYAYDSNGTRLPASLQSMSTGISIQVDDSMAVYPITVDPFIQRSNFDGLEELQRPAFFGGAVAMDGDTIAIAIRDNQYTSTGGVIYVFSRTTAGWGISETAVRLENPGRAKRDLFGISVAVGGDVIVVGAPSAETFDSTGVVYVYSKPTGGWSDDVVPVNLVAPAGDSGGWLGNSVAISGNTIVAGAPYHGGYDEGIGSAFVFTKGQSGWAETAPAAKITPFDVAAQDRFGYWVAINGNSIVVGSPGSDAIAVESGSAYVFARPGTNWVSTSNAVRLKPSNPQAGDFFGHSVAIGADTVVVGAPQTDQSYRPKYPVGNGFVSVFNRSGSYTAPGSITFTASDGRRKDGNGWVVAVDAGTMVVDSPFNDGEVLSDDDSTSVFDSGAAYVYEKPAIGWNSGAGSTKILPNEAESGETLHLEFAARAVHAIAAQATRSQVYAYYFPDWRSQALGPKINVEAG